ncbi:16S rRNA processing protein RimM [Formicincola oecophyllae]|uniref:Ribosome maturation factor RimM n=1 Tax=Formicincola oecophyllae TaxID=2558361 RepID=A0A4Y6U7P6_9PROT|nr:ribosome maturation factor RimM [Formicincola oecophyllae]QDH13030.1 16S rRNA processing protein RimM [Formicincola oecophyllae]
MTSTPRPAGTAPSQDVMVATIGKPHGVRGLVRLYPNTETPEALEDLSPLHDSDGRAWNVEWVGDGIARLRDGQGQPLQGREAAQAMGRRELFVPRARLPEPEEGDFYIVDLVGMEAFTPGGEKLGRVAAVHDYGAGASLELADGTLVPFNKACVPDVDLQAKRLTIVLPDEVEVRGDLHPPAEEAPQGTAESSPA